MKKQRKHCTAEEKVAILRRHMGRISCGQILHFPGGKTPATCKILK